MLSEKQQQLLNCFFDGEAGIWSRIKAKSLIKHNLNAKQYIDMLEQVKKDVVTSQVQPETSAEDLWSKIQNRIEQEERAQLYLGERRTASTGQDRTPLWERYPILTAVGTAVFAFALGIIFRTNYLSQTPATNIAENQKANPSAVIASGNAVNVALGSSSDLELEWVKSDGRVKMIQAPRGPQIIWVRRPKRSLPPLESVNID